MMQAISGVHFNYSFPEKFWDVYAATRGLDAGADHVFRSTSYFDLLRNFRRMGWIILYLFGASPAVGRDFVDESLAGLEPLDEQTACGPHATSLRMSDIGYRNRNQAGVSVSVNSLPEYLRDLRRAVTTPHPEYEQIGLKRGDTWLQLSTNVLQIENEYYTPVRPKRVARSGENPGSALRRAGVEYIEMRALDVSAFDPVGVNQPALRFLEAFAALCILKESPMVGGGEQQAIDDNFLKVARRGREPGLHLVRDGRQRPLAAWAGEILDEMTGICELLDQGDPAGPHAAALRAQQEKVRDVETTPSARLLRELATTGDTFHGLARRISGLHRDYMLSLPPPNAGRLGEFESEARESLAKQASIEAAQTGSFEDYLGHWFASL
jgi:glutamate--cysteine ligase